MKIDSPHWKNGACTKHGIPTVPCPQCLAERDDDVEVAIEEVDTNWLDFEKELSKEAGEPEPTLKNLLPAEHADWLLKRIPF